MPIFNHVNSLKIPDHGLIKNKILPLKFQFMKVRGLKQNKTINIVSKLFDKKNASNHL